jgi:hypothetical protein
MSAQEGCAFILEEAQDMFDAGLIETIPSKLAGCMDDGFTSDERLQAHKLIILSYLFDDNMEEAESAMLSFLTEFPAYEAVATDPREFIVMKETFDTRPVLMIGGNIGANFTFPLATDRVGLYKYSEYRGSWVPGGAGVNASFRIERRIVPKLDFFSEIMFANNRFDFYLDNDTEPQPFTGEITDFAKIEYYETQNRLSLPLGIMYDFSDGDFQPTLALGIQPGVNLTVRADGFRDYEDTGDTNFDPVSVTNIDVSSTRRTFNISAFVGLGFKYKLGPGVMNVNARLYSNLLNQVKAGGDRYIQELAFETFFVTDNLLLNNLAVSAGYMFPIYNPKKNEE